VVKSGKLVTRQEFSEGFGAISWQPQVHAQYMYAENAYTFCISLCLIAHLFCYDGCFKLPISQYDDGPEFSDLIIMSFWMFHQDLSRCKKVMEERGELFLQKISMSRAKVAKLCHTFIKDGAVSVSKTNGVEDESLNPGWTGLTPNTLKGPVISPSVIRNYKPFQNCHMTKIVIVLKWHHKWESWESMACNG